jgi:hypothetical protein
VALKQQDLAFGGIAPTGNKNGATEEYNGSTWALVELWELQERFSKEQELKQQV